MPLLHCDDDDDGHNNDSDDDDDDNKDDDDDDKDDDSDHENDDWNYTMVDDYDDGGIECTLREFLVSSSIICIKSIHPD